MQGIRSWSGSRVGYFSISNFHVDMAMNGGGGISIGETNNDVRVVNNEIAGMWEDGGGSAAIDGSGQRYRIYGNHIHDNGYSKLYHGIYMDARDTSGPDDIDIGYNHIHHQTGGRGIQIFGDTSALINNVRIHHNVIHHIHLDGIVFHANSGTGLQAYDNVVYHTADPNMRGTSSDPGGSGGCIRFASSSAVASVFNNTFADCAADGDQDSGGIRFDSWSQVTLRNNLVNTTGRYVTTPGSNVTSSNNLWFGAGTAPSFDTTSLNANPVFADEANNDYHLMPTSPAINAGSSAVSSIVMDDFDGNGRPTGSGYDVGAFEFVIACIQGSDCSEPPPCRQAAGATCNSGACVYPALADGVACTDDSNACTNDLCQAGACTHAVVSTCGGDAGSQRDAGRSPDAGTVGGDSGPRVDGGACCTAGDGGPGGGASAAPGSEGNGADAGCGCTTPGAGTTNGSAILAGLALALTASARRRRSASH